jgi:predicted RNA-binding protein with PUA-like domain
MPARPNIAENAASRRAIGHGTMTRTEPTMAFLVKEEPENYSFDAFVKDGATTWTGVKNPVAQKHLRTIRKGDQVFYYHTGKEKAVIGIAKATKDAYPDPADKTGKAYVVDLAPVKKLTRPVTLAEVKADRRFASFPLTRVPRLSVMPVSDEQWQWIVRMSESGSRAIPK